MRIGDRGLELIKEFEGCLKSAGRGKFKPYICPAGVLTIGWGHTNHHGQQFDADTVWTQAQCDAALAEDLWGFEKAVKRLVKVPLSQNQFDALVSFTYNCGEGNLAKSSLLKRLNAGDYDGAARQFAAWNRGGGQVLAGLTRRRAAEAALFRAGGGKREPMPQQVDPPNNGLVETLKESKIAQGGTVIAGAEIADTANQVSTIKNTSDDLGLTGILGQLVVSPRFWIAVAVVVIVGLIIYWRWRDHT